MEICESLICFLNLRVCLWAFRYEDVDDMKLETSPKCQGKVVDRHFTVVSDLSYVGEIDVGGWVDVCVGGSSSWKIQIEHL